MYIAVFFFDFLFIPTQIWNGTISHITRCSILLGKSKIFVSMRVAGLSHLSPALVLKIKRTLTGKLFVQANKFPSARMDALCLKPVFSSAKLKPLICLVFSKRWFDTFLVWQIKLNCRFFVSFATLSVVK